MENRQDDRYDNEVKGKFASDVEKMDSGQAEEMVSQREYWEACRPDILAKVMEASKIQPDRMPYRMIEGTDLAAAYVLYDKREECIRTLSNGFLEKAGVGEEDLYRAVLENQEKAQTDIYEIKPGLMGLAIIKPESSRWESGKHYMMTNELGICGAAAILDEKMMAQAAEMFEGDFYLVPTSCHEWQLESTNMDLEMLQSVVKNTNRECNRASDFLSNRIYGYHAEEKRMFVATERMESEEDSQDFDKEWER